MKKMMLVIGVLMMAVAMFAAGKQAWSGAYQVEINKLMLEKNYVAARAYADEFDWTYAQTIANQYVGQMLRIDNSERKAYASIADVKANVGAYAAKVGLTDQSMIDYHILTQAVAKFESKQVAYDFYKSIENPSNTMKSAAAGVCVTLKKFDEALALHLAIGNYIGASTVAATNLKDKAKTFEYCRKAMLDQYCTAPVLVQLLDRVGGFDYSDVPAVTKQMQIDLLTAVDLKYRRFLVKDKPTWEPIIAGIRLTLQGYGVEVK